MSHSDEDLSELFATTQMPVNSCVTSELDATDPQRNPLTQHFMESSRLSSPASSAMIRTRDETVASCYGASSMPSTAVPPSDIMEQIQAKERRNYALQRIQDIATPLKKLSLSIPETRIAIYSRQSDGKSIVRSSSIVHTRQPANGIDTFCVAQRPKDVDYTLEIHLKTPPRHSKLTNIKCQFVYHPGSDDCIWINRTEGLLYLVKFGQSYSHGLIAPNKPYAIQPGLWGIAATVSDDVVDDCIVNFLLCERRHTISIAEQDHGRSAERQSLSTNSATDITSHSPSSIRDLKTSAIKLAGAKNNPLLNLQDGQIATIQAPLPITSFRQEFSIYQLKRVRKISAKGFSSVFSCQHSLVPGNLAVKVIQYESEQSSSQLAYCSELWKREKSFLEKLEHVGFCSSFFMSVRLFGNLMRIAKHCFSQGL